MKNYLKSVLMGIVSGLLAITFTGCGDDNGNPATGPASGASFAGASISFNPTVNFLAGGNLTYINTEAGSPFPAAATATAGTYTYTPNATFTTGTLTMTVAGITDPIVLEISNFRRSGANVTGFTARSGGQNYPVTVTGTIEAYQPSGGGGGAGESRADDIPSSMRGTYSLVFFKSETASISGVPADGTTTTFVISARTLKVGGKTLTDPVFYNDNDLEWLFKDGNLIYAASIGVSGGLNEINIYGAIGASGPDGFYGQYREAVAVTLTGGEINSGTFTGRLDSGSTPDGFPDADAYEAGDTETFVFGSGTVTVDGNTYALDTGNTDESFRLYTATIGGNAELIRVGVSSAGGTDYVSYFTLERDRPAEAPASGTVKGSFFFRVQTPAP